MSSPQLPSGYHRLSLAERQQTLAQATGQPLPPPELPLDRADQLGENVIGRYALPLSVVNHVVINNQPLIVPYATEEPSVVAGASHGAKLAQAGGGFHTQSDSPVMKGQVQLMDLPDLTQATAAIQAAEQELLTLASASHPNLLHRGGGARRLDCRPLPHTPSGPMLIVHLQYDCRDAMGANLVNTALEALAPRLAQLSGGRVLGKIVTNLSDQRLATASCTVPVAALDRTGHPGTSVAQGIVDLTAWAAADPYRAATHNKGILNGVTALAVATGNDFRAIAAGAHAYAAREGHYAPLSSWELVEKEAIAYLKGHLQLPLSVGTVGGTLQSHPTAQWALDLLGRPTAQQLAGIMAAMGLAQNLAALRALAAEGIQQGHMPLHERQYPAGREII